MRSGRRKAGGRFAGGMGVLWAAVAISMAGMPAAQAVKAPGTRAATLKPEKVCMSVPSHRGTGYDLAIGLKQDGKAICARVGERVLVLLDAPTASGTRWGTIEASPPGILVRVPMPLVLGQAQTAAMFKAVKAGAVQLSSERPACAPARPGHATCMAIELWKTGLVISPRQ